jgi:hypothetical protein
MDSLVVRNVEADHAGLLQAGLEFLLQFGAVRLSITKMMSAQETRSCVIGVSASWLVPADATSISLTLRVKIVPAWALERTGEDYVGNLNRTEQQRGL